MSSMKVFVSADHGLAIVYFLQTDVVPTLLEAGVEVILLTDDGLKDKIALQFGKPGLMVEGLRLEEARKYQEYQNSTQQWWLNFLRRVGGSNRINTEAMDSNIQQVSFEATGRRKTFMPVMKVVIAALRSSKSARRWLVNKQMQFSPDLYGDLFDKYKPDLVVASTPGWRMDRYLLRQAVRLGVPTAAVVVGWDNPSSYSIPGATVDWINCWSDIQKNELVLGSDWDPGRVHIGGIPSYDGYFRKTWLMPRQDYFNLHGLDPRRKLLAYACSFITFSPNYQNIEALARLVSSDSLAEPCQLLIRLHPNHFMEEPLFAEERLAIQKLADESPNIHVVEPVPLGGELGYYSGEDMPEKTSMMAYADVFLTVYSTMVVEASIHNTPVVSVCFDAPGGWNKPNRFSLKLSEIGNWPTHDRFRRSGAGKVALNTEELVGAINGYLKNPLADEEKRSAFIRNECTYQDGFSGIRTANFLLKTLGLPERPLRIPD